MKFDKNHPKLTAYALGELNEAEKTQVEQLLKLQPELLDEVAAIQALTANLEHELKAEPSLQLSERRRVQLERQFNKGRGWGLNWNKFSLVAVPLAAAFVAFIYYQKGSEMKVNEREMYMDNQAIPDRIIERPAAVQSEQTADGEEGSGTPAELGYDQEVKEVGKHEPAEMADKGIKGKHRPSGKKSARPPARVLQKQRSGRFTDVSPKREKKNDQKAGPLAKTATRSSVKRPGSLKNNDKKASGVNLSKLGLGAGRVVSKNNDAQIKSNFKNSTGGSGMGAGSAGRSNELGGIGKRGTLGLSDSGGTVNNFGSGGGGLDAGQAASEERSAPAKDRSSGGYAKGQGGRSRPTMVIPSSEVVLIGDGLSRNEVLAVIRAHMNQLRHCYELALARKPDITGDVVTKFSINSSGRVAKVASIDGSLDNEIIRNCITSKFKRWKFPVPRGGKSVEGKFLVKFSPY